MILALLFAQAAAPVTPVTPAAPVCTTTDAALPPPLAGWTRRGMVLDLGQAVTMPAVDPASVRLVGVPAPTRPGNAFAATVTVRTAGTYGVALDQKGWIDVHARGARAAQASTAHGHGPACSTIRKIVRYRLAPGQYRILVSGLEKATAKIMLVRY